MPAWARRYDPRWVLGILLIVVLLVCCCGGLALGAAGKHGSDHKGHRDSSHAAGASSNKASPTPTQSRPPSNEPPSTSEDGSSSGPPDHSLSEPAAARLTVPNVVGKNAAVARDELKRSGFTKVKFAPADSHRIVILPQNWTVKTQSAAAGSTAAGDTVIVLGCVKPS
ncbi:MAG: PASTA domain-containing protein [Terriglobales bacterium]